MVPKLSGKRLILVEDNIIIGLDAETMMREAGAADVLLVHNVTDALAAIDGQPFDLAVLDIDLGDQTSVPVAEVLRARDIPFVFTSGYGEATLPPALARTPILEKPYSAGRLLEALANAARG